MKKLISMLIMAFTLSSSFAQQNLASGGGGGCTTDCFFTDCTIRCPAGSMPKCYCIIGTFGSCKCVEMIGSLTSPALDSDVLPALKNEDKLQLVINFISSRGYKDFLAQFYLLRDALMSRNLENYNKGFKALYDIVGKSPNEATQIYDYVNSLR